MPDNTPAHEACLRELAGLIERSTGEDGLHTTTIPALHFSRLSAPMPLPARGVQEAALCLIVQGAKRAILADEVYDYDASRFVVASVDLPVTAQVTQASADAPYLCGDARSLTDIALLPFIRQFAAIDPAWFAAQPLPHLQGWLEGLLVSDLFAAVMPKFAPWADGDSMLLFGSASVTPAKAGA